MLTLSADELRELTGGYERPADQIKVLHARGFLRATILRGRLVLERVHYEAVCAGQVQPQRPRVVPPKVRAAA